MGETQQSNQTDAWLSARAGNAIDALVDRVLNQPQMGYDPAQAYGVDQNGRIYTLGQTNSQIAAQIQTNARGLTISPWLVLAVIALVVIESK
jgi:hypothetical protein